jgi:hypothetical protein
LWLCVPALVEEAAAGASQLSQVMAPPTNAFAGAVVSSAASVALLFGMLATLTTPIAAAVILAVSLLHRWRLGVVGILWLVVIVAMALMLPAMDRAMGNLMLLWSAGQER